MLLPSVIKLLIGILFFVGQAGAFNVCIMNDAVDIFASKKICAHISFDRDEEALSRNSLCISVDSPDIELKGWRTNEQAPLVYSTSFKRVQRIFSRSFTLEILIDFDAKQFDQASFVEKHLCISALILGKDETTRAECVVVPLVPDDENVGLGIGGALMNEQDESALHAYNKAAMGFQNRCSKFGKQNTHELHIIDQMKDAWRIIVREIHDAASSFCFYKWYLSLWGIFFVLLLRWFVTFIRFIPISVRWHRELFIVSSVLLTVFTWCYFRSSIPLSIWYGALGFFCVPGAFYYLWGGNETFLDRCKVLLGLIFAVALLPLVMMACIHGRLEVLIKHLPI